MQTFIAIACLLLLLSASLTVGGMFWPNWWNYKPSATSPTYYEFGVWEWRVVNNTHSTSNTWSSVCGKLHMVRALLIISIIFHLIAMTIGVMYLCSTIYSQYIKMMLKAVLWFSIIAGVLNGAGVGLMFDRCNIVCIFVVIGLSATNIQTSTDFIATHDALIAAQSAQAAEFYNWSVGVAAALPLIGTLLLIGAAILAYVELSNFKDRMDLEESRDRKRRAESGRSDSNNYAKNRTGKRKEIGRNERY